MRTTQKQILRLSLSDGPMLASPYSGSGKNRRLRILSEDHKIGSVVFVLQNFSSWLNPWCRCHDDRMHFCSAGAFLGGVGPTPGYEVVNLLRGLLRDLERPQASALWHAEAGADLPDDSAQTVHVCLGRAVSTQQLLG